MPINFLQGVTSNHGPPDSGSHAQVEISIIQASNVPPHAVTFRQRRVYVSVASDVKKANTASIKCQNGVARWNETLYLDYKRDMPLHLSIYSNSKIRIRKRIGTAEILVDDFIGAAPFEIGFKPDKDSHQFSLTVSLSLSYSGAPNNHNKSSSPLPPNIVTSAPSEESSPVPMPAHTTDGHESPPLPGTMSGEIPPVRASVLMLSSNSPSTTGSMSDSPAQPSMTTDTIGTMASHNPAMPPEAQIAPVPEIVAIGAIVDELPHLQPPPIGSLSTPVVLPDVGSEHTIMPSLRLDDTENKIKITEAAVESMKHPPSPLVEVLDGIPGAISATNDVVDTWQPVLDKIKFVVDAVDTIAEIHPYAKIAWSVLSAIPKAVVDQAARDKSVQQLLNSMRDAFELAKDSETLMQACQNSVQQQVLRQMLEQVSECGYFIQKYAKDTSFGKRLLRNVFGGVNTTLAGFSTALSDLRNKFLDHAAVATEVTVFRVWDDIQDLSKSVTDLAQAFKRDQLPYAKGAGMNPDKGCQPGTRTHILKVITDWIVSPSDERVFVLFGQAGRGKSAIANELAKRFSSLGRLCTFYSFSRGRDVGREPYLLFPTLARDLADRCKSYAKSLSDGMNTDTASWNSDNYTTLYDFLLGERMKKLLFVGPIFLVIDALDESSDADRLDGLHSFLSQSLARLPSNFRVLITSRPEPKIRSSFPSTASIHSFELDDLDTTSDIEAYIQSTLLVPSIVTTYGRQLAQKSEGLFQWAAFACSSINNPPDGNLSSEIVVDILAGTSGAGLLDGLYTLALGRFNLEDKRVHSRFRDIMGWILAAFEPVSATTLATFYHLKHPDQPEPISIVQTIVSPLGSLLSNVNSPTAPISILHTSFRDFLTGGVRKDRSENHYISLPVAREQLALLCFSIMNTHLVFNICKLESSYVLNSEAPNLKVSAIERYIPQHLSYACRFWGSHLYHCHDTEELVFACDSFMREKFLFWLEVLSACNAMELADQSLMRLLSYLEKVSDPSKFASLRNLVSDAIAFVDVHKELISQSLPHIYISALLLYPGIPVSQQYQIKFPKLVGSLHEQRDHEQRDHYLRKVDLQRRFGGVDRIALAFSPHGKFIAITRSRQVDVLDVTSGDTIFTASLGLRLEKPFFLDDEHVAVLTRNHISFHSIQTKKIGPVFSIYPENEDLAGDITAVSALSKSPDGRLLGAALRTKSEPTLKCAVWDVHSGDRLRLEPLYLEWGSVHKIALGRLGTDQARLRGHHHVYRFPNSDSPDLAPKSLKTLALAFSQNNDYLIVASCVGSSVSFVTEDPLVNDPAEATPKTASLTLALHRLSCYDGDDPKAYPKSPRAQKTKVQTERSSSDPATAMLSARGDKIATIDQQSNEHPRVISATVVFRNMRLGRPPKRMIILTVRSPDCRQFSKLFRSKYGVKLEAIIKKDPQPLPIAFSHDSRQFAWICPPRYDHGMMHISHTYFRPDDGANTPNTVAITDQSYIDNSGWFKGNNGELILWVPEELRDGFHRPSTVSIIGPPTTRLDFDAFNALIGRNWTQCYSPEGGL